MVCTACVVCSSVRGSSVYSPTGDTELTRWVNYSVSMPPLVPWFPVGVWVLFVTLSIAAVLGPARERCSLPEVVFACKVATVWRCVMDSSGVEGCEELAVVGVSCD